MEELEKLTLDQFRRARPDLVTALQQEGTALERARCVSIIKQAHTEFAGMGMETIMLESVETGRTLNTSVAEMRKKINERTYPVKNY